MLAIYKLKTLLLLSAIGFGALSCSGKRETEKANSESTQNNVVMLTPAQFKTGNIEVNALQERQISGVLKLNGVIDVPPQNLISVSVPLGGYLKSSTLLPGMAVKKGQIIAYLEDQQYIQLQQDFLMTKNRLELAETEYNRQKELNNSKAASDKVFQQAQAELTSQKITYRALSEKLRLVGLNPDGLNEKNMSRTVPVYSPINGYVAKVNANTGRFLTPSDILFELVNVSDIHLNLNVFEKDLAKLAIGQRVVAYNNSMPNSKHTGEIILLGRSLTADKATEVHCHFDKYDKSLVPGMYMNAEVSLGNTTVTAINEEAIVTLNNATYVFTQQEALAFVLTPIQTGIIQDGWVTILNSEVIKNKPVVTKGAYWLLMKMKNVDE